MSSEAQLTILGIIKLNPSIGTVDIWRKLKYKYCYQTVRTNLVALKKMNIIIDIGRGVSGKQWYDVYYYERMIEYIYKYICKKRSKKNEL